MNVYHHPGMVVLSILVAILASYTAWIWPGGWPRRGGAPGSHGW